MGYGLWVNVIQRAAPHRGGEAGGHLFVRREHARHLGVALPVAFERQILKPFFHLIGFRFWV
jgi:hypothetical protein